MTGKQPPAHRRFAIGLRRKLRPSAVATRPRAKATPAAYPGPIDVWLQRASHIAQAALFLLTLAALHFTVVPLYEKALLDEQIARKELRLAELEEQINRAYEKTRAREVQLYLSGASAECSGVMADPETYHSHEGSWSAWILTVDPRECLARWMSDRDRLSDLRSEDRMLLERELEKVGVTLEAERQDAQKRYDVAETEALQNVDGLTAHVGKPGTVGELLFRGTSPDVQRDLRKKLAVTFAREKAASAYVDRVREEIRGLNELRWPATPPDEP